MKKVNFLLVAFSVIVLTFVYLLNGQVIINHPDNDIYKEDYLKTSTTFYDVEIDESTPNNWEWAKSQGYCNGSGTENDPYLIYDHSFQYNTGTGHCLAIKNSRKHFKLEGSYFEYSKMGYAGLYLYNTTNGQFESCSFLNNHIGISIENCNYSTFSFFGRVYVSYNNDGIIVNESNHINFDCVKDSLMVLPYVLIATDNMNSGLLLRDSHYTTLSDALFNANGKSGILLNNSNNNLINDCYILNNEDGITLFLSSYNTISNSEIQQNLRSGILLILSDDNEIIDNVPMGHNIFFNIAIVSSDNNTIASNENWSSCSYNDYISSYGIYLDSSSDNLITENTFRANVYGLGLFLCSNNNITENIFNCNNQSGITLLFSPDNYLSGNVASNNKMNGIYVEGSDNNEIYNNIANGNEIAGILISYSSNNQILKNTASSNNIGIHLYDSEENYIVANTLLGNEHCILEEDCEDNIILDNQCIEELDILLIGASILIPSLAINVVLLILIFLKRAKKRSKI